MHTFIGSDGQGSTHLPIYQPTNPIATPLPKPPRPTVAAQDPEEAERPPGPAHAAGPAEDERPQIWDEVGHGFEPGELEALRRSITDMALSRIEGRDELYVGG